MKKMKINFMFYNINHNTAYIYYSNNTKSAYGRHAYENIEATDWDKEYCIRDLRITPQLNHLLILKKPNE